MHTRDKKPNFFCEPKLELIYPDCHSVDIRVGI